MVKKRFNSILLWFHINPILNHLRWAPINQRARMFQQSRYWTHQTGHKRQGPHKVCIYQGPLSFDLIWFPSCITNGIQSARAAQSHAKGRTAKVTCSPFHCALLSAFLDAAEDALPGTCQKSRHVHSHYILYSLKDLYMDSEQAKH